MNPIERSKHQKVIIGSRDSRLAKIQVEEVLFLLAQEKVHFNIEQKFYETKGDKDKITPLTMNPADDFFTDTLDEALLNNEIDVAIHSAKDLAKNLREGLEIFALTASLDDTDAFVGKVKFSQLKPGDKIGTSSLLRQQSLQELNPNLKIINIRGTIEERLALIERGDCVGVVVATAALKRLGLSDKIKDIFPWEATPLQGQLVVVGRVDDIQLKRIFSRIDVRRKYGPVTLVGAGPGDPELITLKGLKALQQADCIFYDYLIHPDLLLYAHKAEKIYVGKRKGEHTLPQAELSKMLRQKAMEGKKVVRLKGGDPLIFGRGADEIEYLQNYHIAVDVIPGITSATGIPSGLGIPLTARGISSSVAFISGHAEAEKEEQSSKLEIPHVDTIVFLMGLTKLSVIIDSLKKAGWPSDKPVMVVSKGTRMDEKIVSGTVDTIEALVREANLEPPCLIIASGTVKFWQKNAKSHQDKILYVGTNPEKYKPLGDIVHFPMIEISAAELNSKELAQLAQELPRYHLILLTSRFAVHYFLKLVAKIDYSLEQLKAIDFAVIGEETQYVLSLYGFKAKIASSVETSEGFLEALLNQYQISGKNILFPRSSLPNPFLKEKLIKLGATVREVVVYKNIKPMRRELPQEGIRSVIFTSPSTVKNFLQDYGQIPSIWTILSKGPHTQKALKEYGYTSEVLIYD